jgi:hypothetical protein
MSRRHIRAQRDPMARLFWGLCLVAIGAFGTLQYLDLIPGGRWENWWPWAIIAIGVARVLTPYSARSLGSGVMTALMGTWLLLTIRHWHGLTWWTSWPLALIAVGVGEVVHAAATPFFRNRVVVTDEEEIHVHQ